jgi:spartin
LTQAHIVSGKAVKVSAKTLDVVEGLVKKAVGRKEKAKAQNTPNLPPRQDGKRSPAPTPVFSGANPSLPPRPTLRKRDKLILSAEVVFATMEESLHRILDTSSEEITRVVTHKYAQSSRSRYLADCTITQAR